MSQREITSPLTGKHIEPGKVCVLRKGNVDLYHGSDKSAKAPVLIIAKDETPLMIIEWELVADIATAYYAVIEEVQSLRDEALKTGRVN